MSLYLLKFVDSFLGEARNHEAGKCVTRKILEMIQRINLTSLIGLII